MTTSPPSARLLAIPVIAVMLVGCGDGIQFARVRGQVLIRGTPGRDLRVEFHPNALGGTKGPSSSGSTNEEGRFELAYATPSTSGPGAAVGTHKVVLRDLALAASETGVGVPVRFGTEYANLLTTPLSAEVDPARPEIVIELPSNTVRSP